MLKFEISWPFSEVEIAKMSWPLSDVELLKWDNKVSEWEWE